MLTEFSNLENQLAKRIEGIEPDLRIKAAGLLPLVPSVSDWDEFKASVKAEWTTWKGNLLDRPACLLTLYCGLAYHEYGDNTLWRQFAEAVGSDPLPANQQQDINSAFAEAFEHSAGRIKEYCFMRQFYLEYPELLNGSPIRHTPCDQSDAVPDVFAVSRNGG